MNGVVELGNQGTISKIIISKVGEIFEPNLERMNVMLVDQLSKGTKNDNL